VIAAALQVPLSLVALSGALLLQVDALFWKQTTLRETGKSISWSIFGFIAGMFIVVQAVESTGLTAQFGQLLLHLSSGTSFGAVMVGTVGSALGTNLINNVPMAVVMTSSLQSIRHAPPAVQHAFVAATIFGCNLGPNLTTVGSLATVLWLLILRQRNVDVSGLDYFKVGVVVTPLMLLVGALAIWLLYAGSAIGPKSVGHVARFVLDHAPCPVLLLRHVRADNFSLPKPPPHERA
jgi:arsenical pump membrane protein